MKVKGRSLLVIIMLFFVAYAYYDYYKDKKASEQEMNDSRLMNVPFDQVEKIEITKADGKTLLKRTVDGWLMEEPLKDSADNDAVDGFIKACAMERILDVVKEGDDIDWKTFGLDHPRAVFALTTTGNQSDIFSISEKQNFEDNVYARRNGENRVLILNASWVKKAVKPEVEFRDRRVFRHKIASVDEIKIKNKVGLLHIKMYDGRWKAPANQKINLDQNKVRDLLQAISDAQGSYYLEPKAQPPLKFMMTMDLMMDKANWHADIGQAEDFIIYSNVKDPAFIMKLEPGALDKLLNTDYKSLKSDVPSKEGGGSDDHQAMIALKNDKKEKHK
jgi:cbb3-type cytochrome oxidase subunit 3